MASAADRAKAAAKRVRDKLKDAEGNTIRRGANVVSSYAIGKMKSNGSLERVPQLFGMPRLATVAGAAFLGAKYGSGRIADGAEGLLDSALAIGSYQFGAGEEVSGFPDDDLDALDRAIEGGGDPLALPDGGGVEEAGWDTYDAVLAAS